MSHRRYNFARAEKQRLAKQRPATPTVVRIGGDDSPFAVEIAPMFVEVTDELRAEFAEAMQQAAINLPGAARHAYVRQSERGTRTTAEATRPRNRMEVLARAQERIALVEQAMRQRGTSAEAAVRAFVRHGWPTDHAPGKIEESRTDVAS